MKPIKRYAVVDKKGNIASYLTENEYKFRDAIFKDKKEAEEMRWPDEKIVQVVITQK